MGGKRKWTVSSGSDHIPEGSGNNHSSKRRSTINIRHRNHTGREDQTWSENKITSFKGQETDEKTINLVTVVGDIISINFNSYLIDMNE